jgi:hypothetical protein
LRDIGLKVDMDGKGHKASPHHDQPIREVAGTGKPITGDFVLKGIYLCQIARPDCSRHLLTGLFRTRPV